MHHCESEKDGQPLMHHCESEKDGQVLLPLRPSVLLIAVVVMKVIIPPALSKISGLF